MKLTAFVPIKLNSQRLPHKNILPIGDKPMCWYIINTLLSIEEIEKVYVYCSNEDIKKYIPKEAIFLKRDVSLDGNLVKGFQIYSEFIKQVDSEFYILAHTTSPFIKRESIINAINMVKCGEYDSSFSAEKIQTFAWYKEKPINYSLSDIPRTQDLEPIYVETSGFFMFKKELFLNYNRRIGFKPYIQEVNNIEAIDIDTKEDYDLALKIFE